MGIVKLIYLNRTRSGEVEKSEKEQETRNRCSEWEKNLRAWKS